MQNTRLPDTVLPILLAGGEGTRLRPITADLPKPLIPVDGVPAVCRILDSLSVLGVTRTVITVRYRADDIIALLGDHYNGIRLLYSREDEPRGTAGGVRDAWARYAEDTDTDALIISGDAVFTCDLSAFAAFHHSKGADASLLCVRVPDPGAFGTVIADGSGRITAFSEKPCAAETLSDTASCGIYCMTRAFLEQIPTVGTPDFGMDILPRALQENAALYAFESPDYWCDIGSFSDYLACSLDISAGRIGGCTTPRSRVILPPYVIDCSVGRECFIPASASVRSSILFDRVVIGTGASVTGSILCENVHVGDGAVIEPGCVIGRGCKIGNRCRLPRGTRLDPGIQLPSDTADVQNAFDSGKLSKRYLSEIGYALSSGVTPEPETAVMFARALAAFAQKTAATLFLCCVDDTPALRCTETLICETLSCLGASQDEPTVCSADGVLPLSVARMPQLPIPDRKSGHAIFRIVFLQRGGMLCAAIFDDSGLHPTRQTERLFDACFADALSAAAPGKSTRQSDTVFSPVRRISADALCRAYVKRYAVAGLLHTDGSPFAFSCGSTLQDRLLSSLLCAMGGEERLHAPLHFSITPPSEDAGDILCPLTVSDLRMTPVGTYSHWMLLSLLSEHRMQKDSAVRVFPTPRSANVAQDPMPLSLPVCAPEETFADYRYTNTPSISPHAAEDDPAVLARCFAAAEAEDAVLLARDIALLCAQTPYTVGRLQQNAKKQLPAYRRHGFAASHKETACAENASADAASASDLCASLSALTRGDAVDSFVPAVEGVVLRRDCGAVRIVATRDRNYRIIADAYSTEAAEELFCFAKSRLLQSVISERKG